VNVVVSLMSLDDEPTLIWYPDSMIQAFLSVSKLASSLNGISISILSLSPGLRSFVFLNPLSSWNGFGILP
jgi:hypothetical protein